MWLSRLGSPTPMSANLHLGEWLAMVPELRSSILGEVNQCPIASYLSFLPSKHMSLKCDRKRKSCKADYLGTGEAGLKTITRLKVGIILNSMALIATKRP